LEYQASCRLGVNRLRFSGGAALAYSRFFIDAALRAGVKT